MSGIIMYQDDEGVCTTRCPFRLGDHFMVGSGRCVESCECFVYDDEVVNEVCCKKIPDGEVIELGIN